MTCVQHRSIWPSAIPHSFGTPQSVVPETPFLSTFTESVRSGRMWLAHGMLAHVNRAGCSPHPIFSAECNERQIETHSQSPLNVVHRTPNRLQKIMQSNNNPKAKNIAIEIFKEIVWNSRRKYTKSKYRGRCPHSILARFGVLMVKQFWMCHNRTRLSENQHHIICVMVSEWLTPHTHDTLHGCRWKGEGIRENVIAQTISFNVNGDAKAVTALLHTPYASASLGRGW